MSFFNTEEAAVETAVNVSLVPVALGRSPSTNTHEGFEQQHGIYGKK